MHSKMEWHHYHFTGVDWDNKNGKKAIFKIQGDGKDWAEDVDGEKGSFDYLMFSDIDHDHPEVRKDIIDWGEWMINETGVAGFRFDAVKHFSAHFLADFVKEVSRACIHIYAVPNTPPSAGSQAHRQRRHVLRWRVLER